MHMYNCEEVSRLGGNLFILVMIFLFPVQFFAAKSCQAMFLLPIICRIDQSIIFIYKAIGGLGCHLMIFVIIFMFHLHFLFYCPDGYVINSAILSFSSETKYTVDCCIHCQVTGIISWFLLLGLYSSNCIFLPLNHADSKVSMMLLNFILSETRLLVDWCIIHDYAYLKRDLWHWSYNLRCCKS